MNTQIKDWEDKCLTECQDEDWTGLLRCLTIQSENVWKVKKYSLRLILSQNASTRMLVNLFVDFLKVNNFFPGWLCHFNLKTSSLARSLGDLMHWSSLRSLLATYERLTCSKSNFLVEQCTVDSPLKVICTMKSFHGTITSRNLQCFTFLSM